MKLRATTKQLHTIKQGQRIDESKKILVAYSD